MVFCQLEVEYDELSEKTAKAARELTDTLDEQDAWTQIPEEDHEELKKDAARTAALIAHLDQ